MAYVDLFTFTDEMLPENNSDIIAIDDDNFLVLHPDGDINNDFNNTAMKVQKINITSGIVASDTIATSPTNDAYLTYITDNIYLAIWIESAKIVAIPISTSSGVAFGTKTEITASFLLAGGGLSSVRLSASTALLTYPKTLAGGTPIMAIYLDGINSTSVTAHSEVELFANAASQPPYSSLAHSNGNNAYLVTRTNNTNWAISLVTVSGTTPSLVDKWNTSSVSGGTLDFSRWSIIKTGTAKCMVGFREDETNYRTWLYAFNDNGSVISFTGSLNARVSASQQLENVQFTPASDGKVWVGTTEEPGAKQMYIDLINPSGSAPVVESYALDLTDESVVRIVNVSTGNGGIRASSGIFFVETELAPELRYLDMAFDTEKVYITSNDSGTLKVSSIDNDLTLSLLNSFGSATYAEIDALTRGLFVRCFPNFLADRLWLYGRDGNGIQFQFSQDNAASFTDLSGSWGTELAIGCHLYTFNRNDILIILENDDIYHTTDGGNTWVKIGDAPGADVVASERHPIFEQAVIVASSTNGDLDLSVNLGVSFNDISIPGGDKINAIKKAF